MKPSEIVAALPQWRDAKAAALLDSPAWAMPCRLGDSQDVIRQGAIRPADPLALAIRFEDEPHTLCIAPSPRFAELSRIWPSLGEVPEQIVLALVEKECGVLLQALENAVRRQLKIDGLAKDATSADNAICAQIADITFTLTRSVTVVEAFGQLRHLDLTHPSIRDTSLAAEYEYAAFALPEDEIATLATGDALLLPELGSSKPRLIADGLLTLDESGVAPCVADTLVHVRGAMPGTVTLGELFDGSAAIPAAATPLKLVAAGRTIATGRLDTLASQNAFFVEAKG